MGGGRWLPAPPAEPGGRPGRWVGSHRAARRSVRRPGGLFRAEAFRALWLRDHVPQGGVLTLRLR